MPDSGELAEMITPNLEYNEKLLWCGCTVKGATWKERCIHISNIVFFLIWTAVSTFMFHALYIQEDKDPVVIPFGIAFASVGLIPVVQEFLKTKGCYAITDKRVIIAGKDGSIKDYQSYLRIKDMNVYTSKRDVGYIYVSTVEKGKKAARTSYMVIGGISDPSVAYRLLTNEFSRCNR